MEFELYSIETCNGNNKKINCSLLQIHIQKMTTFGTTGKNMVG